MTEEIERHARVRGSYQDLSGVEKVEEADGLLSVCLQHEVDQLDGIFWVYRLSRLKRPGDLNCILERGSRRRWARRSVTSAITIGTATILGRLGTGMSRTLILLGLILVAVCPERGLSSSCGILPSWG